MEEQLATRRRDAAAEAQRLQRLHELMVLDSAPEPLFEGIARLASEICGTPIALVSLIDTDRQWFKANVGLPGVDETPREVAFCAHAIESDALLEVPDARNDSRFAGNPLVTGEPDIRFYAGAPLVLRGGERVGTLCVIDRQPRQLDSAQTRTLGALAALVSDALAMRRDLIERSLAARSDYEHALAASEAQHRALIEDQTDLVLLSDAHRRLHYVNPAYARQFGVEPHALLGTSLLDGVDPAQHAVVNARHDALLHAGGRAVGESRLVTPDGRLRWVEWVDRVTADAHGERLLQSVGRDITDRKLAEEALRTSRALLHRTQRLAGVGGWEFDLASRAIAWSDETCRIHEVARGHTPTLEEALGYYIPAARVLIEQAVQRAIANGDPWDLELGLVTALGRTLWVRAVGEVECDATGAPLRLVGALQDITERKRLERDLAGQHELTRVTLDSIADAVITTGGDGRVQYLNPVAEQLCGLSAAAAVGQPIEQVLSILDQATRQPVPSPVQRCLAENRVVGLARDTVLVSHDGTERGIEDTAAPIRNADGEMLGAVLVFRDVTAQRRQAHEMTFRATHDALTGLANRAEFELRLGRLIDKTRHDGVRHALMVIDLDRFKLVNDACGHAAGDRLLRQVSALLRQSVRSRDTVARIGGDEFGVLLEQCQVEQARRVAQQICDRMEAFGFVHNGRRFGIGASIGLVPLDARWAGPAPALLAADGACYTAKHAGRSRVHTATAGDVPALPPHGAADWAARLEAAFAEGRFELHAQRIEPLSASAARGVYCEVIACLHEADGTRVAAAEFMPTAERLHLASRIDRWLLDAACARLAASSGDGEPAIALMIVPLTAPSIADRALHGRLAESIASLGAQATALCIRISEAAALAHPVEAADFMLLMRTGGARVALGGLGTGLSALSLLRTLPVDFVKIDGAIVRRVAADALDRAAVRCWRDAAQAVGAATIAEGVECDDVKARLRATGIDFAQGSLVQRPEGIDFAQGSLVQRPEAIGALPPPPLPAAAGDPPRVAVARVASGKTGVEPQLAAVLHLPAVEAQ